MKSDALKPVFAVLFAALIFWIGFTFHSCRKAEDPAKTTYIKGAETTALIKGKDSLKVAPGEPDTVVKYVPYPVYVSVPEGVRHGQDSSSYNLTRKEGIVNVTTFPATDSVRIEFLPMAPERIITRIDTLFHWRVDTLRVFRTDTLVTHTGPAWYESWWFGGIVASVAGLTVLIIGR